MQSISVELRAKQSFLLGGELEHTPYVAVHGTWPAARVSQRTPLPADGWTTVATFAAPDASFADARLLHLRLYVRTNYAAVADIDAAEHGHVTREIAAGSFALPLADGQTTSEFVDHYIAEDVFARARTRAGDDAAQHRVAETLALNTALKMTVDVRVTAAAAPVAAPVSTGYGTPAFQTAAEKMWAKIENAYVLRCTELSLDDADPDTRRRVISERFRHNPREPLVEKLHLVQWDTPTGRLLPEAFAFRAGELEPPLSVHERFVRRHVDAAMLQVGLRPAEVTRILEEQFAAPDELLAGTVVVLEGVARYAANTSNAMHYTADVRYPNLEFVQKQTPAVQRILAPQLFDEESKSDTATPLTCHAPAIKSRGTACVRCGSILSALGRRRVPTVALARAAATAKLSVQQRSAILCDSWDTAPYAAELSCADCDDMGFGILTPLAALRDAAAVSEDAMLRALGRFLGHFEAWATGSTVTSSPYLKGDTKPRHDPLPVPGSAADLDRSKWAEGGHAFAALEPRAPLLTKYQRGVALAPVAGGRAADVAAQLQAAIDAEPTWTHKLSAIFLEGTGPGSPWLLPYDEVYAGVADPAGRDWLMRRTATTMAFARRCGLQASPAHTTVGKYARPLGHAYEYWAAQTEDRRVHPFYRAMVHLFAPGLRALGLPQLVQTVAVDARTRVRGVAAGDYLRDTAEAVALVGPYGGAFTAEEWTAEVDAYHRVMLQQQPLPVWGRTVDGTPLEGVGAASLKSSFAAGGEHGSWRDVDATLKSVEHASEFPGTHVAVLPFFTAPWRLADGKLFAALDQLKAKGEIVDYQCLRDRPMHHLDEMVELLVVLPLCDTAETLFPK